MAPAIVPQNLGSSGCLGGSLLAMVMGMDRVDLGMRSAEGGHLHVPGRDGATPGAGIAIGVSRYTDSRLSSCPAAARTALAVAQALGPLLSNGVTAVVDP